MRPKDQPSLGAQIVAALLAAILFVAVVAAAVVLNTSLIWVALNVIGGFGFSLQELLGLGGTLTIINAPRAIESASKS